MFPISLLKSLHTVSTSVRNVGTHNDSPVHQDGESQNLADPLGDTIIMMQRVLSPIEITIDKSQNRCADHQDGRVNRHHPKSDFLPPLRRDANQGDKEGQFRQAGCVESQEQGRGRPGDQGGNFLHVELGRRDSQSVLR